MGLLLYSLVLMAFISILYKVSSTARYYLKFTIFIATSIILATCWIPFMLFRPRDSRNGLLPAAGVLFVLRLLGVKVTVEGKENAIKRSGAVVLMNHQSMLDLLVLAKLWPLMDNCTVISKKEVFYVLPFGIASWLWGTIFIDRVNREQAQAAVNKTGEIIRKREAKVLIFPEGTRNSKDKLLPFKKGAFHLALAAKCPILPVAVSRYSFLGKNRFDDGHITIKILPAISTDTYSKDNLNELVEKTYNIMAENVELISVDDRRKKD